MNIKQFVKMHREEWKQLEQFVTLLSKQKGIIPVIPSHSFIDYIKKLPKIFPTAKLIFPMKK